MNYMRVCSPRLCTESLIFRSWCIWRASKRNLASAPLPHVAGPVGLLPSVYLASRALRSVCEEAMPEIVHNSRFLVLAEATSFRGSSWFFFSRVLRQSPVNHVQRSSQDCHSSSPSKSTRRCLLEELTTMGVCGNCDMEILSSWKNEKEVR
jgi:hypothetical protein